MDIDMDIDMEMIGNGKLIDYGNEPNYIHIFQFPFLSISNISRKILLCSWEFQLEGVAISGDHRKDSDTYYKFAETEEEMEMFRDIMKQVLQYYRWKRYVEKQNYYRIDTRLILPDVDANL